MPISLPELSLSVQRGLWCHVSADLRAVCTKCEGKLITVIFYYDGEITEEKHGLAEDSLDDVLSDFHVDREGNDMDFYTPILQIDYPQKLPLVGEWVYYRYEPQWLIETKGTMESNTDIRVYKNLESQKYVNYVNPYLYLSVQNAMLGKVLPDLRIARVYTEGKKIGLLFYYQGKITEEKRELVGRIVEELRRERWRDEHDEGAEFVIDIRRLDYPQLPTVIGETLYRRYEPDPEKPET
jgi:hypothetical protein